MPDFLDFIPLYPDDDENTILDRLMGYMNEGVDPSDDNFIDDREGAIARTVLAPIAREFARFYDRAGTEVPAVMFPQSSWGQYLDDHAEAIGLERLEATFAEGIVTFTAPNGTVIPTGTQVSTLPPSEDEDGLIYEVITGGTVTTGGEIDLDVRAVEAGGQYNVGSGAVTEEETPVAAVTARTNADPITGGSDPETDEALRDRIIAAYKGQGGGTVADYEKWVRAYSGVGRVTIVPLIAGAGTVGVIVAAADGSPLSQDQIDQIQEGLDPASAETLMNETTTLPDATLTVHDTTGFRASGFIRVGDQLVAYTGTSPTTFTGASGGTGGVTDDVTKVTQGGSGNGRAPIGHHVTVMSATALDVIVACDVEYESGYSLDGADGTTPLEDEITTAVVAYIESIIPGDEIVLNKVKAAIVDVTGVHDVGTTTLNGGGNITLASSPPETAAVTTPLTLT